MSRPAPGWKNLSTFPTVGQLPRRLATPPPPMREPQAEQPSDDERERAGLGNRRRLGRRHGDKWRALERVEQRSATRHARNRRVDEAVDTNREGVGQDLSANRGLAAYVEVIHREGHAAAERPQVGIVVVDRCYKV